MGTPSAYYQLLHKKRRTTVVCRVCGKRYQRISPGHLRAHGLTLECYRRLHGDHPMISEDLRFRHAVAILKHSEEEVISKLQEMDRAGRKLFAGNMEKANPSFFFAVSYMFGAWHRGLEAAGLDAQHHTKPHFLKEWAKPRILHALRDFHQRGFDMTIDTMRGIEPRMVSAISVIFKRWDEALRAAGIDSSGHAIGEDLRKRSVIRSILAKERTGDRMNYAEINRSDRSLLREALRIFGSWDAAILAAGLEPERIRACRRWTPKKIIARIHEFASEGGPLNRSSVKQLDGKLVASTQRHFGSWDAALQSAGFDPNTHRKTPSPWTREKFIDRIRKKATDGDDLRARSVQPRLLHHAGCRLFGSWDQALRAADLDPKLIRNHAPITRVEIVEDLLRLHASGHPLNYMAVRKSNLRLVQAGARLFGGWPQTLEAAGFDSEEIVIPRVKWTRERILEILEDRRAKGQPLNPQAVYRVCSFKGVKRVFGSYENALQAAGIHTESVYLSRRWTRIRIVQHIQSLHSEGTALNARAMLQRDCGFLASARNHFGRWDEALREAGLDPARHRKIRPVWTRDSILVTIRECGGGGKLSKKEHTSLRHGAQRIFGSWQAAIDAAENE